MELTFADDFDSAKQLDEIMNSYPGRDQGTIMADKRSMGMMIFLLVHRKITVTECIYPYDVDILDDIEAAALYAEVARLTHWRRFDHTQIERVRINALRQMRQTGTPSYDGNFVCYQKGRICAHCGNLDLSGLLMYLSNHEQVRQFYLFTFPDLTKEDPVKYYRFDLSKPAIQGAQIYRDSIWDDLRKASEVNCVIPEIPALNEPSS